MDTPRLRRLALAGSLAVRRDRQMPPLLAIVCHPDHPRSTDAIDAPARHIRAYTSGQQFTREWQLLPTTVQTVEILR